MYIDTADQDELELVFRKVPRADHWSKGLLAKPAGLPTFSIGVSKGEDDHNDIDGNHRTQRPKKDGITHNFPLLLSRRHQRIKMPAHEPC